MITISLCNLANEFNWTRKIISRSHHSNHLIGDADCETCNSNACNECVKEIEYVCEISDDDLKEMIKKVVEEMDEDISITDDEIFELIFNSENCTDKFVLEFPTIYDLEMNDYQLYREIIEGL